MFKNLSQKNFLVVLISILIISIGIVAVLSQISNQKSNQNQTNQQTSNSVSASSKDQISQNEVNQNQVNLGLKDEKSTPVSQNSQKISQKEFEKHFTKTDCWVSFEKKVYNVTTYLRIHPGGQSDLAKFCSREIDKASSRHPGGPFGSIEIQNILAPLLVGELE